MLKTRENKSGFSWAELAVGAVFLIAAIALCLIVFSERSKEVSSNQLIPLQSENMQSNPAGAATIVVDVKGNVVSPGVYTLPAGSRVQDAIEAAGGFCSEEDSLQVNLAKKLTDGEMILIGTGPQQLININTASPEELDSLPGIGEVLAGRIVQYREEYGSFYTVDDLKNVQGIGNALFEKLKDLITV